ncbi:beta-ketoacyl-[acyl-carrier-protein] synthase family protein [Brochothrix thermosphacta]|uniref:beta-ketoacyl-[acyl-carrier-protein] synthase family protein n=1 Tax=Brochothrix thermosphacta TaxID=2756 RepID=UPI00083F5F69|nr:beta-ketoacyl-[acyl-carrier-protein] synthase family protein [Brochothrix thermosphacta]ODJ58735.1 beta-ketoacyl-[acyl-carrier-protein] synthase II [Brochothrix thermosphacta]
MQERVVITGMGMISPLGYTVDESYHNLRAGKSGIQKLQNSDAQTALIGGVINDPYSHSSITVKERRRLDRFAFFALEAAQQAFDDSEIENNCDPYRLGTFVGSGIGGIETLINNIELYNTRGPRRVSPSFVPMIMPNAATGNISIAFNAKGPSYAPVSACATGNTAIGEAYRQIKAGYIDAAFAGGSEASMVPVAFAGFANARALSSAYTETPEAASRPFDDARDGFVMGEGGAVLILESLSHAYARGAKIYAKITGYGTTTDAHHLVAPEPTGDGAYRAMTLALADAHLQPKDIDVISAHATSTPLGDAIEAASLHKLFKEELAHIPVTANKSMTGHLFGAAGAFEAIALAKMLANNEITPTRNYRSDHHEGELNLSDKLITKPLTHGLSNSFGFGGHNAVLVISAFTS